MKCPECSHDQKYRDGMVCGGCGYPFRLDPKKWPVPSGSATDGFFRAVLRRASCGGTARFTKNQLYAAAREVDLQRSLRQKEGLRKWCWVLSLVVLGMVVVGWLAGFWIHMVFAFPLSFVVLAMLIGIVWRPQMLKRKTWDKVVDRWLGEGGELPGLIGPRELGEPPGPGAGDAFDYGFGQLLICQHEEMVDALVLNGFHTENACVVMAESGYPQHLLGAVAEELAKNPELGVFLWHDAGEEGEGMEDRLRSEGSAFELAGREVFDLGMEMGQVKGGETLVRMWEANGKQFPADLFTAPRCMVVLGAALSDYATLHAVADGSVAGAMEILEGGVLRPPQGEVGDVVVEVELISSETSWEVGWEDACEADGDGDGDGE